LISGSLANGVGFPNFISALKLRTSKQLITSYGEVVANDTWYALTLMKLDVKSLIRVSGVVLWKSLIASEVMAASI